MMDIAEIEAASRKAAVLAAAEKKQPYVPFDEKEIQKGATVKHIPNLGDYRPKGWRLVDHWLCDNSGFGSENEPALTASQRLCPAKRVCPKNRTVARQFGAVMTSRSAERLRYPPSGGRVAAWPKCGGGSRLHLYGCSFSGQRRFSSEKRCSLEWIRPATFMQSESISRKLERQGREP